MSEIQTVRILNRRTIFYTPRACNPVHRIYVFRAPGENTIFFSNIVITDVYEQARKIRVLAQLEKQQQKKIDFSICTRKSVIIL